MVFAIWLGPLALSAVVFGLVGLASLGGGAMSSMRRPLAPIVIVTYRARVVSGELRTAPEEVSEASWFARDELPPIDEIAWPSHVQGLDAWRAFERARP